MNPLLKPQMCICLLFLLRTGATPETPLWFSGQMAPQRNFSALRWLQIYKNMLLLLIIYVLNAQKNMYKKKQCLKLAWLRTLLCVGVQYHLMNNLVLFSHEPNHLPVSLHSHLACVQASAQENKCLHKEMHMFF